MPIPILILIQVLLLMIALPIHAPVQKSLGLPSPTSSTKLVPALPITSKKSVTSEQKRRIEQLTSVFENGTLAFDYAVIENLDDGRGYTAGRAGFTTATGDAYLVAKRYTAQVADNPLASYLSRLKILADEEDDNTSTIVGFPEAWKRAALDARFRGVQDAVIDELYYQPAMKVGDMLGVTSALGRAMLYDTIIQHGGGDDEDSLAAIVKRTTDAVYGTPENGVSETLWLETFLNQRRQNLLHPTNKTTQDVWAVSVGRVEILRKLLSEKNLDLHGPIIINTNEYQATIQ